MPGSVERLAGEYSGPGGAFATGQALDVAPGGPVLLGHADWAAGDDGRFGGVSDDELLGIVCAADRSEAAASALKHSGRRADPAAPGVRLHSAGPGGHAGGVGRIHPGRAGTGPGDAGTRWTACWTSRTT